MDFSKIFHQCQSKLSFEECERIIVVDRQKVRGEPSWSYVIDVQNFEVLCIVMHIWESMNREFSEEQGEAKKEMLKKEVYPSLQVHICKYSSSLSYQIIIVNIDNHLGVAD
ncbi:hypothetical protein L6452_13276 [Arctium lappa]|uniref:Uncharacterized protein n=1 Tax=Arctium lappa TaxID=4217 RepID=A0ACB9CHS4_ARCLA|nr:hypothetical protein L6452_13276 [Arctium lappa]